MGKYLSLTLATMFCLSVLTASQSVAVQQGGETLQKSSACKTTGTSIDACLGSIMQTVRQGQDSPYCTQSGQFLLIGNEHIGVGFDKDTLKLLAVVDVARGGTLLATQKETLWEVRLVTPGDVKNKSSVKDRNPDEWSDCGDGFESSIKKLLINASVARERTFSIADKGGRKTLLLSWTDISLGDESNVISVQARIEVGRDGRHIEWKIDVDCKSKTHAIWQIEFPRLEILPIGSTQTTSLLIPGRCHRVLNPFLKTEAGKFLRPYPGLYCPMQFSAVYGEESGLYLGTQDPGMNEKDFVFDLRNNQNRFSYSLVNLPKDRGDIGIDYHMPYAFVMTSFKGNWFDACRIYREWAIQQQWCSKGPIRDHKDRARSWYREIGPWMIAWEQKAIGHGEEYETKIKPVIGPDRDQSVEDIANITKQFQIPTAVQFLGWQKGGGHGYNVPDLFPPLLGKAGFSKQIKGIHDAGCKMITYVWGDCWQTALPSYKELDIEKYTVKNPDGKTRMYGLGAAYMCPSQKMWKDTWKGIAEKLAAYDVDGIYWDVLAGAVCECFDDTHGHSKGGGNYYAVGTRQMLADCREAMDKINPGMIMASEFFDEIYIDSLDGMLLSIQNYMLGTVPAIQAVYHDYAILYGNWGTTSGEPGVPWIKNMPMPVGLSFVVGNQTGWHNNWHIFTQNHPRQLDKEWFKNNEELRQKYVDFSIQTARLRYYAGKKFLAYGEMRKSLEYKHPMPHRKGIWQQLGRDKRNQHRSLPEVMNSTWKAADGSLGLVFCNISDSNDHTVEVDIDLDNYEMAKADRYVLLERLIDGSENIIQTYDKRKFSVELAIKPLTGRIYEIKTE